MKNLSLISPVKIFWTSIYIVLNLFIIFQSHAQETNYVPEKPDQIIIPAKSSSLVGKGILGIQVLIGGSYENIKPGINAVKGKDTTEVEFGPGGGIGMEIYGGKQLDKIFRFGLHAGFMVSSGIPPIKDLTIRYTRFYAMPVLNAGIRLNSESQINIGIGGYASFGNSLYIKVPSDTILSLKIVYKPNFGVVSHIQYEHTIENCSFFGGLRFHWVNLEVGEILAGGRRATLTPSGNATFNNKNGGGVALQFGMNYFF